MEGWGRTLLPSSRRYAAIAARGISNRQASVFRQPGTRQPDRPSQLKTRLAEEFQRSAGHGSAQQRGRGRPAPVVQADQGTKGRRQALPPAPPSRQALPAVPAGPRQPGRRVPGQQQSHAIGSFPTGRTERRRAGPRYLPEARAMVRRSLARPLVRRYLGRARADHR